MIPMVDLKAQYLSIKEEIDNAIFKVLDSGNFILGENVKKLEDEIANFCSCRYGVAVNSGTDALYLSLLALKIAPGDEIITTPFTFIATVEPILLLGAIPVFVDIDEKTFNIDVNKIEEKITRKTKAIISVHLYGLPVDMEQILSLAKKYKLKVIEDSAQSIGAIYKSKKVCSFGDFGCVSFYPAKNLGAYGDGGMVVTNNSGFANKIKLLRDHGSQRKYCHKFVGLNSRLDEIQAAILRVKFKHLQDWIEKRRENAKLYNETLKNSEVKIPFVPEYCKHVYNQYTVKVKNREKIHEELKNKGISAGVHYPIPLHLQEALKHLKHKKGDFPVSENIADSVLSLPIYPELKEEEIKYISDTLLSIYFLHSIHS